MGAVEVIAKTFFYFFFMNGCGIRSITETADPAVCFVVDRITEGLRKKGYKIQQLDGDTIRSVFPQTGFTKADRDQHIRRVGFLASLLEKNGTIVVSSFISPYRESRQFVRDQCRQFVEVYVSAPLETCKSRDVKDLYKKARSGDIKKFTGIDEPYV